MYYLILETSSPRGLLSILKDQKIIFEQEVAFGVRESNELTPLVEMALKKTHLDLNEIGLIVIGQGPGSFTGLRIGASVARAFSFAHQIPIACVDSLKSFTPSLLGAFGILVDAKSQGVYLQKGYRDAQSVQFLETSSLLQVEEIAAQTKDLPLLITPYKGTLPDRLDKVTASKLIEAPPSGLQMLSQALRGGEATFIKARDPLNLQYFNTR